MAIKKDLSIDYLGVKCENPFFLSSSPIGGDYDMIAKAYELGWAGVFFKTVGFWIPVECSPRFDSTNKEGTLFTGFKNMEMISDKPTDVNFECMFKLKRDFPEKIMVATIMGNDDKEWADLAKMCEQAGADLIEGNFSCPQMTVHSMGSDVGTNLKLVEQYNKAVTKATKIPFIAKMTPNLTVMEPSARAAVKGGAKGISAINTVKSITNIDLDNMTGMPVVAGKSSITGYSGAAIRPIALRFIANLCSDSVLKEKGIEISGVGGIETWRDALEFLVLGARNVQVTTGVMQYGYRIVTDMISGLSHWMDERGYDKIDDFIGAALPNIVPAEDLDRTFKVLPDFNLKKCVGCGRCYISCYDAAHQAIDWDEKKRRPVLNDNCVGCHLCVNVCPVKDCILPGEVKYMKQPVVPGHIKWEKAGKRERPALQTNFD